MRLEKRLSTSVLLVFLSLIVVGATWITWLYFDVYSWKPVESRFRMSALIFAIRNYKDSHKSYPPPYTSDSSDGKLLSWRALVLPHAEKYQMLPDWSKDESWKSDVNREYASKRYSLFEGLHTTREIDGATNFVAVLGERTFWSSKYRDIGRQQIAIMLELPHSDIHWCEPRDVDLASAISVILNSDQKLAMGYLSGKVELVDRNSYTKEELERLFQFGVD